MQPPGRWVAITLVLSTGMLVASQPMRDKTDPARNRLLYGFSTLTPVDARVFPAG